MSSPTPDPKKDFLDRTGEDVVLSKPYRGRIVCRTLTVPDGVVANCHVNADKVVIRGSLEGMIVGSRNARSTVTVEAEGSFEGEIHATLIEVKGRADGILHSAKVVLRKSAVAYGYVLSDLFVQEEGAQSDMGVFSGPGKSSSAEHLATVRKLKGLKDSTRRDMGAGNLDAVVASGDVDRHLDAMMPELEAAISADFMPPQEAAAEPVEASTSVSGAPELPTPIEAPAAEAVSAASAASDPSHAPIEDASVPVESVADAVSAEPAPPVPPRPAETHARPAKSEPATVRLVPTLLRKRT